MASYLPHVAKYSRAATTENSLLTQSLTIYLIVHSKDMGFTDLVGDAGLSGQSEPPGTRFVLNLTII